MENEQNQKAQAAEGIGQAVATRAYRHREPRELRVEHLDGGFVVMTTDGYGNYGRQVIPNAESLGSFVQKWVNEK